MPGKNKHLFASRAKRRGNEVEPYTTGSFDQKEHIVAIPAESVGVKVELSAKSTLLLTFPDKTQLLVKVPPVKKSRMSNVEYAALATTVLALNLAFSERTGPEQVAYTVSQESDIKNLPSQREADPDSALRWACATLQGIKKSNGIRGRTMREIAEMWIDSNDRINAGLNLGTFSKEQRELRIKMLENVLLDHAPGNSPNRPKKKVEDW